MNAQQKKNGWFFNKNIIDEINSIPEEGVIFEETIDEQSVSVSNKQTAEIMELKRKLSEKEEIIEQVKKDSASEKQRLTRENEKYKQVLLRTGEEKAETRRQLQELEAEGRKNRQEIHRLQENKETGYLKEQLTKAEEEVASLTASLEEYQTLEKELQEVKQQYHDLTIAQQEEESQRYEHFQQLEQQMAGTMVDLHEKEALVDQLNQFIVDRDQLIIEKEDIIQQLTEEQKQQDSMIESEIISTLQHQVTDLKNENEQLKKEAVHSQHEIGEVLISARRQANRMVEKAKLDAQRIVKDSEAELQTIHDRAKEISCEVDESRQTILSIYEELKSRVDQLAHSEVPNLEEVKERYEYPKVSTLTKKNY